ncbi:hypothetical protein B0T25DRAFT_519188 [Lasiosphaeria hispida]|uniref:Uncharacterized protein n=1 Tax=Lasiosphaeria hispida TaxID=260671 RepID=A0AAJ0MBU5_9PEZI|nr:hypothetical protein B0T25DRAFT_519188 [Lasiosphaeria hispida]
MAATKTYFIAPGWEISASKPLLGSIIANPSQPDTALFTASPARLAASSTTTTTASAGLTSFTTTTTPSSPEITPPAPALFSTFLTLYGLGDEPAFSYDRKHSMGYSFRGQKSTKLVVPVDQDLLRAAVTDARIATLFANNVGVYLVTGIKSVAGAGVSVASGKGRRWAVSLGVGLRDSEGGEGGAEGKGKGRKPEGEGEREGGVVYAVEVKEVKVQEGGEVMLRELDVGQEKLQGRLDGEFGEGAFRVVEGVDESAEGGEPVQIVTANLTHVDLLTASTVKVGGLHGIWH